jgi:hypothetical protein
VEEIKGFPFHEVLLHQDAGGVKKRTEGIEMSCGSTKGRCSIALAAVFILLSATPWGCGGQGDESGRGRSPKKETAVTGEDVKREFDKAFDTTKKFLKQKGSSLQRSYEESLRDLEKKADLLQEEAGRKKEEGRARAEETMKVLREKQEEARKKFEEFKNSGAELRDEAAVRMEKAFRELEDAYRQARERFDSQDD